MDGTWEHTPGPWHVHNGVEVCDSDGRTVARRNCLTFSRRTFLAAPLLALVRVPAPAPLSVAGVLIPDTAHRLIDPYCPVDSAYLIRTDDGPLTLIRNPRSRATKLYAYDLRAARRGAVTVT